MLHNFTLPELVEMGVQQGTIPRYLFKYRTISPTFDNILINDELWFSKPVGFNDPFDCQITIDNNNSQAEIEDFVRENLSPRPPQNAISGMASNMVNNPALWDKMVNDAVDDKIGNSGICCFAGNQDNLLLWAHYTDSHKGICLKFDLLADPAFFITPLKVIYQGNYPVYNHLRNQKDLIDLLVKTKGNVWAYEQEVRVMKLNAGLHKFNKASLIEIIFGCKCTDNEVQRVKNLALANNFKHTTFTKAQKKRDSYGLDFITV